jgi:hypothetical protein
MITLKQIEQGPRETDNLGRVDRTEQKSHMRKVNVPVVHIFEIKGLKRKPIFNKSCGVPPDMRHYLFSLVQPYKKCRLRAARRTKPLNARLTLMLVGSYANE